MLCVIFFDKKKMVDYSKWNNPELYDSEEEFNDSAGPQKDQCIFEQRLKPAKPKKIWTMHMADKDPNSPIGFDLHPLLNATKKPSLPPEYDGSPLQQAQYRLKQLTQASMANSPEILFPFCTCI
jgi:hypothetical protein